MKKKQRRDDLIGFMHELISHLHAEGRYGTAHVYRSTLRRIIEFEGGRKEIPLTNVTTCWLNAFQNYLLSRGAGSNTISTRSEEHTSELQSRQYLVCRLLLEKKKITHLHLRFHEPQSQSIKRNK